MNAEDAEPGECTPGVFATDVIPSSANPFFNILFSIPLGNGNETRHVFRLNQRVHAD